MKKYLFATASVFALTLATTAQANDSTISQIGATQTATVDQTGGSEGVSSINQIGANHTASVTQADDPNNGTPAFNTASNTSSISQEGDGAIATVNQTGDPSGAPGNISEVTQFNDGPPSAIADVLQDGTNNFSSVEQGRDVDPVDRRGQNALISQTGSDHISTVLQRGNLNDATVTQSGLGNTSDVTQGGLDNLAGVTQSGDGNLSTVSQSANFGEAQIEQSGNSNESDVVQDGRANSSVAALILQDGNNNTSTVLQTSLVAGPGSGNQFAEVTQSTDWNSSVITQDGGDPVVDTVNTGNSASVFQTVTSGNMSNIAQSGAGNSATVNQ
ncbi:Curlin associated repeat-containing protein [Sulfitobacter noctilucicola]|uniref:Curlin associated repeat-containing protein n=1 Tax=Sulfitobacter noctilucicola TaxID=1342301 RepID=A0A7W6Q4B9_9RHOB|nr:hypothetical protein [Sulfitobacter noctilucicola]KIN63398.1 Curlin associated repeat-containing protein [Sulfitobacter noctilucicola]MBB4175085.1 hypothetical protein [Sulfitobacter noctilucicola]